MRNFDKVLGVTVVLLAGLTIGSTFADEQRRESEQQIEQERFRDVQEDLRQERREALERAREAEQEAARLREALIALALADDREERLLALGLIDPQRVQGGRDEDAADAEASGGPEGGTGAPGARDERVSGQGTDNDPRQRPPSQPPADRGPVQGPVAPLVPDEVEDPVERLIADLVEPVPVPPCASVICLPHP